MSEKKKPGKAPASMIADEADLNPDEILARLSPEERRAALWQRAGIVSVFAEEYRRELIALESAELVKVDKQ